MPSFSAQSSELAHHAPPLRQAHTPYCRGIMSNHAGSDQLRKLLLIEKLAEEVVDYMMADPPAGLGLQSVMDFSNFFIQKDYH